MSFSSVFSLRLPKLVWLGLFIVLALSLLVGVSSVSAAEVIVDDGDPEYSDTGWTPFAGQGLNNDVHFEAAGTGSETATWVPTIPTAGDYEVYVSWSTHPNRATNAPYTVNHAGGSFDFTVNQELLADQLTVGGSGEFSGWYLAGTFTFAAGTSSSVVLDNDANEFVIADAVRLVSVPNEIHAFKFEDRNADGIFNGGDTPIENWEIRLRDDQGNLLDTQFTNATGTAWFLDLDAGDYSVEEVVQPDWFASTPTSTNVTLGGNGDSATVEFGNYQQGEIRGRKFEDLDADGVRDAGEPWLEGWAISLEQGGLVLATTTTDVDGRYIFDQLDPDSYEVHEEQRPGWTQTAPTGPEYHEVTIRSGQTKGGRHFGNRRSAAIHGAKFHDINGDGVQAFDPDTGEPLEPFIEGWKIRLKNLDTNDVISTFTDENGQYWFMDLFPGNYRVSEKQEDGWVQTSLPQKYNFELQGGDVIEGADFGNFLLSEIHGLKFHDHNGDGIQDAGDEPLEGWTIQLFNGNDDLLEEQVTNSDGEYWFMDLGPDTYTVGEVMQSGWGQSLPDPLQGSDFYEITTESGVIFEGVDFGNFMLAKIRGRKFHDLNCNGNRNGNEPWLEGWTITLYDLRSGAVETKQTDALGRYRFNNLRPGQFIVVETLQSNWVPTNPPSGSRSVAVVSDENLGGQHFGNVTIAGLVACQFSLPTPGPGPFPVPLPDFGPDFPFGPGGFPFPFSSEAPVELGSQEPDEVGGIELQSEPTEPIGPPEQFELSDVPQLLGPPETLGITRLPALQSFDLPQLDLVGADLRSRLPESPVIRGIEVPDEGDLQDRVEEALGDTARQLRRDLRGLR